MRRIARSTTDIGRNRIDHPTRFDQAKPETKQNGMIPPVAGSRTVP